MTLVPWHRHGGWDRSLSHGERLAGACRGRWGKSVLCSAHPRWGCLKQEHKAAKAPGPVRLGGKLPPGKQEPDTLGGTGASCCFPFSNICKSVKYSCRATCEGRLTPLSVRRFSSPAHADSELLREFRGGWRTTGFLLSFRIPVLVFLGACQWLMIKYSY